MQAQRTHNSARIAIAFPANPSKPEANLVENSRLSAVALAFIEAGAQVLSAPFSDEAADAFEAIASTADCVLVWYNPFESGRDRSRLNTALKSVAAKGVRVSADPDVIDAMGTKDVLYRTRHLGWGSDVERYASAEELRAGLLQTLRRGSRVLKQLRGQSGDGIWQVSLRTATGYELPADAANPLLTVRHAKSGSAEEQMHLDAFVDVCAPYFAHSGAMIDQAYQSRLDEGMIRCYMVGSQVAGFGEQLINALYPAPTPPGPRLYFPADRPDFQALKHKLEHEWIAQMCESLDLQQSQLPALWDADFMFGSKNHAGEDSYVLCEINVSSVYPFPPSALKPLVDGVLSHCRAA